MAIVVDTNALFALVNANDEDHRRVVAFVESTDDVLILPVTVLPEIDYLITRDLDIRTELALLRDVAAGGYRLEDVTIACQKKNEIRRRVPGQPSDRDRCP